MASLINRKLTGLVAATFTPLTAQGEPNLPVIGPYVDYLVEKQGVLNVFAVPRTQICGLACGISASASVALLNGTTGEGVSLCTEERKRLTEEWCRRGKGKLNQVIVHVGCYSLKDSQELARHAAEAGADGIAVIAPSFFKSATADGIRRFLQEIAAEAPTLPFYYYHIPAMTGLSLRARDVLEGIDALIPTFRGLKFSGSDLMDFGQCVSYAKPHWSLLYGVDEQLLAALSMGADGAVGSTFNYLGPLVNGLLTAYGKGDVSQARTLQLQMQEFLCPAVKQGFDVAMNKQLMSTLSGLPLGPPCLPLLPCPAQLTLSVAERIQQVSREHRS